MKKYLLLVLMAGLLFGCAKTSDVDYLQQQIDELKSTQIASISSQLAGITLSIGNLQTVDAELRGYISTLQEQKTVLENTDQELGASIEALKSELSGEISEVEANVLAQLEAFKTSVSNQLASINASIAALQSKDRDLQQQITTLKNYVENDLKAYIDEGDNNVKTWASATFVTLEQYNVTAGIVAGIQGQIETINQQLAQLANITAGVSQEELNQAIEDLDESLQEKIRKSVSDCNTAIDNAKQEITAAYTSAIRNAISASESSMKSWVNTQLAGYYTIAQTDSKLTSLRTTLENKLNSQKTYLEGLLTSLENTLNQKIAQNASEIEECRGLIATCNSLIEQNAQAISDNAAAIAQLQTDLATARTEITTAYKQAISTAITTLDGKLSGQIADEVETINGRIDSEVETINNTISALTERVSTCEREIRNLKNTIYSMQQDIEELQQKVSALLSRIQSLVYIPQYSDGKAIMTYTNNGTLTPGTASLDFEIKPAGIASELVTVWRNALYVKAVYTVTKSAPEMVDLVIESVEADGEVLSLTISGAGLKDEFFKSQCSASIRLGITDGNNDRTSEYITLVPWTQDVIHFEDSAFKTYCVENFDTSGDGEISADESLAVTEINAPALNITSLNGIEYFSNLERLDVSFNKLTSLSLVHNKKLTNVFVNGNKLQTLNLDGLAHVKELDCSSNKLESLDVSVSDGLRDLNCASNALGSLDLRNNKALVNLQCSSNNIGSLNLLNNTNLETMYCRKNSLSSLDVRPLTKLKSFDCSNNALHSLNVYNNTALQDLACSSNQLSSLDVFTLSALRELQCQSNAIETLDISSNAALESLNCSSNALSSLNVSRNASLANLICNNNQSLAKLWLKDAAQQAAMSITKDNSTEIFFDNGGLYIPDNNLKAYLLANYDDDGDGTISVQEADNVTLVNCSGKGITDLTGLEACTNLTYVNCANNSIGKIDFHTLTKLETLVCYGNPLTEINLNNCDALSSMYIIDISTQAVKTSSLGRYLSISGYSGSTSMKLSINGTSFYRVDLINSSTLETIDLSDNSITDISAQKNTALTELKVNDDVKNITASNCSLLQSINVSACHNLERLLIDRCALTSLDLTHNAELIRLKVEKNNLPSLNLTKNTKLKKVIAFGNSLPSIDVTKCPELTYLDVGTNNLSSINVRSNPVLDTLSVTSNPGITVVNVTQNPELTYLNVSNTKITDLDISLNTNLVYLNVQETPITVLDLSNNKKLRTLLTDESPIITYTGQMDTLIGCCVTIDGMKGVIFYAAENCVKLVSIDEASKPWDYYRTKAGATSDSDGVANTNKIPNSSAAKWCRDKGDAWYLPAQKEMLAIYNNKAILNTALSAIGGKQLGTGYYWTSTESNDTAAYRVIFSNGASDAPTKTNSYYVRAVRSITIINKDN